jgi:hypothetical protein
MKTSRKFNVDNLLDNLSTDHTGRANNTFTNAQKAYERKIWLQEATKGALNSTMLADLGRAIDALPKGTIAVPTFNANTGVVGQKKINYRDIAKTSLTTAWKNAVKGNENYEGTQLKWKGSVPEIIQGTIQRKSDFDRVVAILDEKLDSKAVNQLKALIAESVERIELSNVETFARENQRKVKRLLSEDYGMLMARSMTVEQAVAKVAILHDMEEVDVKAVLGK